MCALEPTSHDTQQLTFIDPTALATPEKPLKTYTYREVKKRIPEILKRHRQLIDQALPTLGRVQIPEQAKTMFGQFLERKQRDALGLSFEIRSMTSELVKKNTLVAFYLRYLEEKKLYYALGYRSFKDYAVNYFNEMEYSYLTRLKRIAYMSQQEIKEFEPLGTTKMMMLAQLNKDERKDIMTRRFPVHENEYKNVVDMSTRELGRMIQKQKNPNYKDNLLKGVPGSLLHQIRTLEENFDHFELDTLRRTHKHTKAFLKSLEAHLDQA